MGTILADEGERSCTYEFDGELVYGKETQDGICIHSEIYKSRKILNQLLMLIQCTAKFFSTWQNLLPISQDSCAFYERTAMFNDYDGVANGPDEGINIAKSLADKDFIILQNHGILTTGSMVDTTVWYFQTWRRFANHNYLPRQ